MREYTLNLTIDQLLIIESALKTSANRHNEFVISALLQNNDSLARIFKDIENNERLVLAEIRRQHSDQDEIEEILERTAN